MDNRDFVRQTRQARGKLMRFEQDMGRGNASRTGANRNRIVGGVLLLGGVLALIAFMVGDSVSLGFVAVTGLWIGGLVFSRAKMKMGGARRSVHTTADDVTGARANLTELEAQSPPTE